MRKFPAIREIQRLIIDLKRSYQPGTEGLELTVSTDARSRNFGWQTGDNSFTGGAYGYPHWAVVTVYGRSNSRQVAREIVNQWRDLTDWQAA